MFFSKSSVLEKSSISTHLVLACRRKQRVWCWVSLVGRLSVISVEDGCNFEAPNDRSFFPGTHFGFSGKSSVGWPLDGTVLVDPLLPPSGGLL